MSTRGEGETHFEAWAVQHDVRFKRIRAARGKRPDYWLICPGGACVVEVKDLAPNAAEECFERKLKAKGRAFYASTPGERLRRRLKRAAEKYEPWRKRGIPCLTFVFNNTKILSSTDGVNVFAAMFGQLSYSVPIAGSEGETEVIAEDGFMTPDRNKRTSVVAVNEWDRGTGYTMIVYHNPYALTPVCFRHLASIPGVRQFRTGGRTDFWVEI